MNRLASGFLLLFLALGPCTAIAGDVPAAKSLDSGQHVRVAGVPNAGRVSEHLYRGAQPREGGLKHLKNLGISTIVDLRGEDAGSRDRERKEAESLGIRFISLPLGGFSPPNKDQVAAFLSLFVGQSPGTVFVHCHFGEDRTGVLIAAYRIAIDHWTPDDAIKEMYFFGFNHFWHPAMISYVRNFPAFLKSDPALSALTSPLAPTNSH